MKSYFDLVVGKNRKETESIQTQFNISFDEINRIKSFEDRQNWIFEQMVKQLVEYIINNIETLPIIYRTTDRDGYISHMLKMNLVSDEIYKRL